MYQQSPTEKKSAMEKLAAQWPGFVGLLLVGFGAYVMWQANQDGRPPSRAGIGTIALGVAAIAYWALANRNDDYNF